MPQVARHHEGDTPTPLATGQQPRTRVTLLDLVAAVVDSAESDEEVIATVHHMLHSGRIKLVGQFRNRDLLD